MKSQFVFVSLLFFLQPVIASDCGASINKKRIAETEALVRDRAQMRSTVGEYPTSTGTKECVRIEFSITPWGKAFNLSISETTANAAFEMAAIEAVKKYTFKGSIFGVIKKYSLVFNGVDNKLPDGYYQSR